MADPATSAAAIAYPVVTPPNKGASSQDLRLSEHRTPPDVPRCLDLELADGAATYAVAVPCSGATCPNYGNAASNFGRGRQPTHTDEARLSD